MSLPPITETVPTLKSSDIAPKTCPFGKGSPGDKPGDKIAHEMTVLQRHAGWFAVKGKEALTKKSMTDGHTVQAITAGVYPKVWAITNMLVGKPSTVKGICSINNPARAGFWTLEGNFDDGAFAKLAAKSIEDKGEQIITRAMVNEYLTERHGGGKAYREKKFGNATRLALLIPVSWEAVTSGSFDE